MPERIGVILGNGDSVEFRVEDFVPPQLKVALSAGDGPIRPGEPFPIEVAANYYYGAPGAELAVQAQATISLADNRNADVRAATLRKRT